MTGKLTLSVHDDIHHQNAEGIEYDLWRINQSTDRIKIKHDRITNQNPHLLIQANTPDELGSFEIVLYVKDYFEHLNRDHNVQNSRIIVPVGINQIDQDNHLSIHLTSTGYTCTL
jgi:5-hydroxyisourate hydrolase-like protein (transthyretin family)